MVEWEMEKGSWGKVPIMRVGEIKKEKRKSQVRVPSHRGQL